MLSTGGVARLANSFDAAQRRLLRTGFAVFLLIGGIQALYGPALPSVRTSFAVGTATAGWTIGAHGLGAAGGVLLSLALEGRWGSRLRLTIGLLAVSAGAAAFALVHLWPVALIGPICVGLGYGILAVAINSLFATEFGRRSAALVTLVNAAFGMGSLTGPLLYGLFSSSNFRPAFVVIALVGLLLLPLAWTTPDRAARVGMAAPDSSRAIPLALAAFMLFFLLYTGIETDVSGWMATHLVFHGFSQAAAAALTSAFWCAVTVGRLLAVPISLRFSPRQMVTAALLGIMVLCVGAHFALATPVAYVLMGLCLAPIFPVVFAWLHDSFPTRPGSGSLALLGSLAGAFSFPILVGRLLGAYTPDVLPLALGAIAVAALLVLITLPRRPEARGASPAR